MDLRWWPNCRLSAILDLRSVIYPSQWMENKKLRMG
jgi:hypothetical protein